MFQQHVLHRLSTFFCLVEVIFFTIFFFENYFTNDRRNTNDWRNG